MNERLIELAKQAQIGLFEDKSFGWSVIAGTDQHLTDFAKLIIEDCARIGELKEQGASGFDAGGNNVTVYDPDISVGWYMKKNFGFQSDV